MDCLYYSYSYANVHGGILHGRADSQNRMGYTSVGDENLCHIIRGSWKE